MDIISYIHKSVELLFQILGLVEVWSCRPTRDSVKQILIGQRARRIKLETGRRTYRLVSTQLPSRQKNELLNLEGSI
jgi:hypothetical protein